jgi:integrative and conjugative element protein (TIGR02256 family)
MQVVWLPEPARALMEKDALKWSPRETGGPLFGYERYGELTVTRACLPGPAATHLPMLYRPDRRAVQRAIDEVYEESDGHERWIGSWHTHPLGRAQPSWVDQRTAGRISAEDKVRCQAPLMAIQTTRGIGSSQRPGPLGFFRWDPETRELEPVTVREPRATKAE